MVETAPVHIPKMEEGQPSMAVDNNNNINTEDEHKFQDARFSCNICFDAVTEPVVTRCGHLYCWPCLYRWLAPGMTPRERASLGMRRPSAPLDEARRVCPVCKSECSVPTVVPIYVRSNDDTTAMRQQPPPSPASYRSSQQPTSPPSHLEQRQEAQSPRDDISDDGNMGLDIDGDDDDDEVLHSAPHDGDPRIPRTITTSTPIPTTTTGLRQRRRNESRDDLTTAIVPTRPMPNRDTTETSPSNSSGIPQRAPSPTSRTAGNNNGPTPNHHARATLSYGLVLAMHQTLLQATNSNVADSHNTNSADHGSNPDATDQEAVPSLHYPHRRDSSLLNTSSPEVVPDYLDSDPAATVFLSRLLLGLSLFVLFCLLSF